MFGNLFRKLLGVGANDDSPFSNTHRPQKVASAQVSGQEEKRQSPVTRETPISQPEYKPVLELVRDEVISEPVDLSKLKAELESASSFDDCWRVYEEIRDADDDSELVELSLKKCLMLAQNVEQCDSIYQETRDNELENECRDKIEEFFLDRLKAADSVDDCFTIEDEANNGHSIELEHDVVVKRAIELICDSEDCRTIIDRTRFEDGDDDEELVYMKFIGYCESVEECAEFWSSYDFDHPFFRAAVCRAAEIIKAEDGTGNGAGGSSG